jgi:hypothetical protein
LNLQFSNSLFEQFLLVLKRLRKRNKVVMRFSIILSGCVRDEGKMISISKEMAKELSTRFGR